MGLPIYTKAVAGTTDKTRVVVLGTGWGAMSMIKSWRESLSDKYELILVSPRNYFVYTPLLPAMCAGACRWLRARLHTSRAGGRALLAAVRACSFVKVPWLQRPRWGRALSAPLRQRAGQAGSRLAKPLPVQHPPLPSFFPRRAGTVEERSIVEAVRAVLGSKVRPGLSWSNRV